MKEKTLSVEDYISYQMEQLDKQECDLERHRIRVGYLKTLNRRQANIISATRAGLEEAALNVSIKIEK